MFIKTHIELITPPLAIMDVDNGCESYSSSIFIPAKSELTSTVDTTGSKDFFFIAFNAQFQNMTKYGIWFE